MILNSEHFSTLLYESSACECGASVIALYSQRKASREKTARAVCTLDTSRTHCTLPDGGERGSRREVSDCNEHRSTRRASRDRESVLRVQRRSCRAPRGDVGSCCLAAHHRKTNPCKKSTCQPFPGKWRHATHCITARAADATLLAASCVTPFGTCAPHAAISLRFLLRSARSLVGRNPFRQTHLKCAKPPRLALPRTPSPASALRATALVPRTRCQCVVALSLLIVSSGRVSLLTSRLIRRVTRLAALPPQTGPGQCT